MNKIIPVNDMLMDEIDESSRINKWAMIIMSMVVVIGFPILRHEMNGILLLLNDISIIFIIVVMSYMMSFDKANRETGTVFYCVFAILILVSLVIDNSLLCFLNIKDTESIILRNILLFGLFEVLSSWFSFRRKWLQSGD